jgi:hypothetical protein
MTAERREELLSAYLDDELSADERAQVEAWLAESAEYRQLYEELRAVRHDLESLPRHKLAEDLGPAVLRRAERAVLTPRESAPQSGAVTPRSAVAEWWSRGSSRRMFIWPVVAVAAALLVALFDARQDQQRELARKPADEAPASRALRRYGELRGSGFESAPRAGVREEKLGAVPAERDSFEPEAAPTDSRSAGSSMRRRSLTDSLPASPAVAPTPAFAQPPRETSLYGKLADSLKMDSNVPRALANKEQVNLIQCDVSSDFVAENQIEKVLASNKVPFKRAKAPPVADDKDVAGTPLAKTKAPTTLWYSVEASPEQVEQIVTQLQREQGLKRVSNLSLGLQTDVNYAARAAKSNEGAQAQAGRNYFQSRQNQQSVNILLRPMEAPQAAQPAKP